MLNVTRKRKKNNKSSFKLEQLYLNINNQYNRTGEGKRKRTKFTITENKSSVMRKWKNQNENNNVVFDSVQIHLKKEEGK
jgi:hypothetical protein